MADRQTAKDASVGSRRAAIEAEVREVGDKLARLYRGEIDNQLKARITALKSARNLAQASLGRIAAQVAVSRVLAPDKIAPFADG